MADRPLRPAIRRRLGRPLPHQQADRPRAPPEAESISSPGHAARWGYPVLDPVSQAYPGLRGRFLTCYSPVRHSVFSGVSTGWTSFDLHVLSTPPAFVLSQDQTLHRDPGTSGPEVQESRCRDSCVPRPTGTKTDLVVRISAGQDCVIVTDHARTSFWLPLFRFQGASQRRDTRLKRRRCRTA